METYTARLTLLVDPDKKRLFEKICAAQDLTSSQVVRRFIREYIDQHAALIDQEALAGETSEH
ncbi:MAG: ribbon-helix-helix protein, CopG family [Methylobacter sp.]|uniref:Ribbon-helix-helix protein, CopG family n=1 Tax=Candidatus Methylobacter titanis TaxID=3053457 RepID=A0AA43Q728_9GAMM|nr:ribbon-helix-helix protein, CopG family [Candidatus Methylobacter titanis]MDI1291757.1 ribbon-helix-helix protein, CopG family [Candidatus Methylobacter titanis]MDO9169351.1 ribbon-helix-helix protein, CopG family [Methylobacter sp.]